MPDHPSSPSPSPNPAQLRELREQVDILTQTVDDLRFALSASRAALRAANDALAEERERHQRLVSASYAAEDRENRERRKRLQGQGQGRRKGTQPRPRLR